ncbi:MAG: hypothetical protein R6U58_02565 [Bacteroidales bacterium]
MEYDYLCPICEGHLRVGDKLVFAAKTRENKKGLIFLSPELGNYTTEHHPSFDIQEGEEYRYYCPICHASLNQPEKDKLVKIFMVDENEEEFEIFFSGIAGEKCTYRMRDKEKEEFGPDRDKYKQYFDLPDEYRKYL